MIVIVANREDPDQTAPSDFRTSMVISCLLDPCFTNILIEK